MNKARLIITAIHAENLTQDQAARRYGVSQSWVSKLLHRHRSEGEAAFTPKSKRPHNTPQSTIDLIREIRATLEKAGHDAGIINPRNDNPRNERILWTRGFRGFRCLATSHGGPGGI